LPGLELAFGLFLAMLALQPAPVFAQAAGMPRPVPQRLRPHPPTPAPNPAGVPDDSSATTLELTARRSPT